MAKRKSLGRGLEALLSTGSQGSSPDKPGAQRDPSSDEGLRDIAIDQLSRGQYQPRVDMREEALKELAESIKEQGVVQPIVVRPLRQGGFEIVAGERRWRAAQLAGLETIPAVVRDLPDRSAIAVALIENIQREDLNPLEEARALKRLIDEFDVTHGEAASAVGRSRSAVTNLLRLLELPPSLKTLLEERKLNMGHARALLGLPDAKSREALGRRVAAAGLSVRETERLVSAQLNGAGKRKAAPPPKDPDVRRLETDLSERLGAPVAIESSGRGGKLVIRYTSPDELEGILDHIR